MWVVLGECVSLTGMEMTQVRRTIPPEVCLKVVVPVALDLIHAHEWMLGLVVKLRPTRN